MQVLTYENALDFCRSLKSTHPLIKVTPVRPHDDERIALRINAEYARGDRPNGIFEKNREIVKAAAIAAGLSVRDADFEMFPVLNPNAPGVGDKSAGISPAL